MSGNNLATYVSKKFNSFGKNFGDTISAMDIDEKPENLFKLSFREEEKKAIRHCQHYSIMYRYRNNLIHEARRPGEASEMMGENQDEACYHSYADDPSICLLYPLDLFKRLCFSSIESLGTYLRDNKIDPFSLEKENRFF